MSLRQVDHFIYDSTSYTCYFDSGLNAGAVSIVGPHPHNPVPLPNSGRGYTEGQFIMAFCSDNPVTTKVSVYASTSTPYCTFVLETNSIDCPLTPPVGGCDLAITSAPVTNESATGADDGTVTINATSTAGGITYSINGTTFVSTNTFIGLSPGNYTAYSKDANACEAILAFSILAYNNPVQNFEDDLPVKTVSPSNISKWNAAFNSIVVNFQRKDFSVIGVTRFSATQIAVQLSTTLTVAQYQLAINDVMYFKTGKYEFLGKADSYSVDTLIITWPYTENDTTGYLNINGIKPGYYTQVELKYGIDPSYPKLINSQFSPNSKGATRADLSPFLQTLLDFKDNFNYTDVSYSDTSIAASYQLRFREFWTGGNGDWFSAPYPMYVVRAAMQLGEKGNGNMAEFVPFMTVSSSDDKAKFLTNYKSPIYWQGLPFEVSFIYSEDLVNQELTLELQSDCGAGSGDTILINSDASDLLDADLGQFLISRSTLGSVPVIEALGVNRVLMPDNFDCCATKIKANIYYLSGSTKIYVMKDMYIRTECPCDEPYVYLKWINSYGAWDYYRFAFNQFLNANISNDQSVKRFVTNWETDDTIEDNISKSSIRSLRVGASNVDSDTANALQWARKSIKAMMLVNSNPIKWQTVIIKDGSTDTIQTRKKNSDVSFELLLVSDNIQNQ